MTCMETQRQIMPFINKELDMEELNDFLSHVKSCPICMEELEVYYVLLTSMKHLDEDQELSNDYHKNLMDLLKKSEESIIKRRKTHIRKRISLFVLITIVSLTTGYHIGEYVVEDVINKATKSDFMPKEVSLYTSSDLPVELRKQCSQIYLYLRNVDKEGAEQMYEYYGALVWNNMIIEKQFGSVNSMPEWTVLYY